MRARVSVQPSQVAPPSYWVALEGAFSSALRSPLRVESGRFRAVGATLGLAQRISAPPRQDQTQATLDQRVQLYQEQHWMRLFDSLHQTCARTAAALGYFRFNQLAQQHLLEFPPSKADLGELSDALLRQLRQGCETLSLARISPTSDALVAMLAAEGRCVPLDALAQCVDFDAAERSAAKCCYQSPWSPTSAELAVLESRKLQYAQSFELLREDWGVREISAGDQDGVKFVRLAVPAFSACVRTPTSVQISRVEPLFAALLKHCRNASFGAALEHLARELKPADLVQLRDRLPAFVQLALSCGYWVGLEPEGR